MEIRKKITFLASLVVALFLLMSCGEVPGINKATPEDSSSEKIKLNEKEVIEKGYPIEGYRYKLMSVQKKNKDMMEKIFSEFDTIVIDSFGFAKENMNVENKIDVVPSGSNYSVENEELAVNYFLINHSQSEIESIRIQGSPDFKDLGTEKDFDINFSKEDFTLLKQNEFIIFSTSVFIPIENFEKVKDKKPSDLTITITNLEINGEKVDNINN